MGSPLGPTQRLVLLALEGLAPDDAPLTPYEIGERLASAAHEAGFDWPTASSEQPAARGGLRGLERRGLVERRGLAWNGARCWAITPAGRDVLKEPSDGR